MFSQTGQYLLVTLIVVTLNFVLCRPKCSMTESYADDCGKKLMFIGEHSTRWPTNDEEMQTVCNTIDEGLQCMKKYSKTCLDPFASQIMNTVVKGGERSEKKYCKDENGRKELVQHFTCTEQTDDNLARLHLCMDKFIVQMEHLANVSGDFRLPATCCAFIYTEKCVKDTLDVMCNKPESVNYINKFLHEITSDVLHTGCGKFDNIGHCDAHMNTKEWSMLQEMVASDDPKVINAKRIFGSPFIALKNLMKELIAE